MVLAATALPSDAHEGREVSVGGEDYEFVVGWNVEPAFVEQVNAVSLDVHHHGTEEPVTGLEQTLQVEISTGGRSTTLAFRPRFGEPGRYVADLIPTVIGSYTFRIFGTLGGGAVNEVFECSETTFACIEPRTDLEFPETLPTMRDVWSAVTDLRVTVARLTGSVDQFVAAQQASLIMAVASLGLAVVAIAIAIVAVRRSGRKQ
jgi:hypothetical protein